MRALGGLLVGTLLLAGCAGDDGGDRTALERALDEISASAGFADEIAWGDLGAIREAGRFEAGELEGEALDHWARAYGMGLGPFLAASRSLEATTGFDVTAADEAVTLGAPPGQPTRLTGDELDVEALREWLADEGAEEDGDLLRLADDDDTDPGGPQTSLGLLNELNVVHAAEGLVVAASNADSVRAAAEAGDESLADDPDVAAAIACLGEVVAVYAVPGMAVGVVDEDTEVLCAIGGDEDELRGQVEERLDPERVVPSTGQPLGDLLEAPEVTTGSEDDRSWARGEVALVDERPVGVLWEMLIRRDL